MTKDQQQKEVPGTYLDKWEHSVNKDESRLFKDVANQCSRLNGLRSKNKLSDAEIGGIANDLTLFWQKRTGSEYEDSLFVETVKLIIDGYLAERTGDECKVCFRHNPFISDQDNIKADIIELSRSRVSITRISTGERKELGWWGIVRGDYLNNLDFSVSISK